MNEPDDNKKFYSHFWDGNAAFQYLENSAGSRWFCALLSDLVREIDYNIIHSIADLGCGIGIKTKLLANLFPKAEVTGFDFAEPSIQAAKKYWKYNNVSFQSDDITNSQNMYDIICMFDVLEHIEDWRKMLDKIMIIADKYIILSFPTGRMRPYEKHIGHYRNFVRGEVESYIEIMRAGGMWKLVKRYNAGFPFFSPILRDLTNLFFKNYSEITYQKMSKIAQIGHYIYYILLRYFSFKQIGDNCMLLFEKK